MAGYSTDVATQVAFRPVVQAVTLGYHLPSEGALVQARANDDADAELLAISGTGTARSRAIGVSATGDSHARFLSMSGTGYAGGCGGILDVCEASISGAGDAQGTIAASGAGDADGFIMGVSALGNSRGWLVAISGAGNAHAFSGIAMSGTGDADTYYQPIPRGNCYALSVTGNANGNDTLRPPYWGSACKGISVMGEGDYFSGINTPRECVDSAQNVHVCEWFTHQGMGLLWFLP